MYSTYWVLQNDGYICQLSSGLDYKYSLLLSMDSLDTIKEYISNSLQKIPMIKEI